MPAILRNAYGEALLARAAKRDFVVFFADSAKANGIYAFTQEYPRRSFNFGIAEQNMMSAAAGFSSVGVVPFVNTFGVFASSRVADQLRNSVAYPGFNVKIVASHVGLDAGDDGASHMSVEDLAIVQAIPNMIVLIPADRVELESMVDFMLDHRGPVFMRTTRQAMKDVLPPDYRFELGRSPILRTGTDVSLFAAGVMIPRALAAAEKLAAEGISAEIVNLSCLKPLDERTLSSSAAKTGAVVTAEDHNIYGGVGAAVSGLLACTHPVPVEVIGIRDRFGESGDVEEIYRLMEMSPDHIAEAAKRAIGRRDKKA